MVSKLSENGVAGFLLANGALSGCGDEYKTRKKLIENNLVEAILILPRSMFYTTDISVTLWILNKNKKERTAHINGKDKNYRNREKVALNYHNWQQIDYKSTYKDVPEFCKSASFEDLEANNFSLVPSKYIEFVDKDSGIDFDTEMKRIKKNFKKLLQEEKESQKQLIDAFKTLGYEI